MAQSKGVLSVLRTEDLMKRNTALKVHRLNEICTLVNILLRNNNCSPAPACWKHKGGFLFIYFFFLQKQQLEYKNLYCLSHMYSISHQAVCVLIQAIKLAMNVLSVIWYFFLVFPASHVSFSSASTPLSNVAFCIYSWGTSEFSHWL